MPYLGVAPNPRENREVDDISSGFNGGTTQFTLQSGGSNVSPGKDTAIIVSLGGVVQNPGTDYTIAASTITFTTAPASGLTFFGVVLAQSIDIETTADNTVTTAKIVDDAVTAAKLASNSVVSDSIVNGSIVNADVNASAAIAGTKVAPAFGTQNITTSGTISSGNIGVAGTAPTISLTDTNANDDFEIKVDGGLFEINDATNSANRFKINSSGNIFLDTSTLTVDATNNRVGIGTTGPTCPLNVLGGSAGDGTVTLLELNHGGNDTNDAVKLNFARAGSSIGSISLEKVASNNTTDFILNTRASNTVSESVRITGAGNVGIGTSSPSQKLQVAGDVLIDGAAGGTLTLGGSAAHTSKLVIADNAGNGNGNLLVEGGDGSDFFTINSAGNVKFEDNKKALFGAGADLELYHDSVGSIIQNQTGPLIIKGSGSNVDLRNSNDEIMIRANGGGAVDLRHANSVRLLTTSSGITFTGNDNSFNAGANAVNTTFVSAFGGAGATSVIRVKMNTSAVNGMQIQQAGSGTAVAGGNHAATVFNTENAKLRLGANNVEHFRIENNGDLKATDTSIGSLSDSRLKKNIVDFTYDLTKFKNFRPRIFDWINPELHLNQSQVRGFVAQEIETVDSTLVGDYTLYDETLTDKNPDLEIIKADDGTNIAKDSKLGTNDAMYISVIQQMLTKIETLETKVAALEAA